MLLKLRYAGQRRRDADCPDAFICQGLYYVSAVVARRAHNPEVVGSNPTPATKKLSRQDDFHSRSAFFIFAAWLIYATIKIF